MLNHRLLYTFLSQIPVAIVSMYVRRTLYALRIYDFTIRFLQYDFIIITTIITILFVSLKCNITTITVQFVNITQYYAIFWCPANSRKLIIIIIIIIIFLLLVNTTYYFYITHII